MEIGALLAGLTLPEGLVRSIRQMIAEKLAATEDATMPRLAVIDAFIADVLSVPAPKVPAPARREISAQADAFFAGLLLGRTDAARASETGSTCS